MSGKPKGMAVGMVYHTTPPAQSRDTAARASAISTRVVRTLIDTVAEAGVSRVAFLRAARLDPTWLREPDARMPRAKLYELIELALRLTGDPAFDAGLRHGWQNDEAIEFFRR